MNFIFIGKRLVLLLATIGQILYGPAQIRFSEIATNAGVRELGYNYGVSFADFDRDGLEDIFVARRTHPVRLYRNLGNLSFEDVSMQAGLSFRMDVRLGIWGDVNNDGWVDLLVGTQSNGEQLLINKGDGTFENISESAGMYQTANTMAAIWGDVNNDGLLDIYVTRQFEQNTLYMNQGNQQFIDAVFLAGATDTLNAMGATFIDYDNDLDLDLYLVHDGREPNILYQNDGKGHFTDVSMVSGTDYAGYGMGVDVGDINNDGWMDLYITNLYENTLLLNQGDGSFADISLQAGIDDYGMGWGVCILDVDNDSWKDIYVANTPSYPNILYKNNKDLTFSVAGSDGPLANPGNGFGTASADLDQDGKTDIFLTNSMGSYGSMLFHNQTQTDHNWIKLKTIGKHNNYCGIGARIRVFAKDLILTDYVSGGSSWASQNSMIIHFGLGRIEHLDSIIVEWPGEKKDIYYSPEINTTHVIVENEGGSKPPVFLTQQLKVAPNPAEEKATIFYNLAEMSPIRLCLTDMRGKDYLLLKEISKEGMISFEIDLQAFPSGIYFLKLETFEGVFSQKLIIN